MIMFDFIKKDEILKINFYQNILSDIKKEYEEWKKSNIKDINVLSIYKEVVAKYEVIDENDIEYFNKYMPNFFKNEIKKLLKKSKYFYPDCETNFMNIFEV